MPKHKVPHTLSAILCHLEAYIHTRASAKCSYARSESTARLLMRHNLEVQTGKPVQTRRRCAPLPCSSPGGVRVWRTGCGWKWMQRCRRILPSSHAHVICIKLGTSCKENLSDVRLGLVAFVQSHNSPSYQMEPTCNFYMLERV